MSPTMLSAKYHAVVLAIFGLGLLLWVDDASIALSFILGGLNYSVPNLYFVHYAFRFEGASQIPLILRSFSWGESGKFALTVMGFVLVFRFVETLHHFAMFAGFITMTVLQWIVAVRLVTHRTGSNHTN